MAHSPTTTTVEHAAERRNRTIVQMVAIGAIAALAAVLRFGELGTRAFHPQESVASLIARQAALGNGYEQIPYNHGPLHYLMTAGVFRLFGDSDFTARALPALFGVLLVVLPVLFARQIGRAGTIVAALLLAVSPTLLYYSRFAGPDMYLAFFSMAMAIVLWRYLNRPERAYLYVLAAVMALMFVTTEMALVVTAIFVAYLWYRTGAELSSQMSESAVDQSSPRLTHYELLGIEPDATVKQVREAYRRMVDLTETRSAREALAHAYGVLTHESRRAAYDRKLARARAMRPDAEPAKPGATAHAAVFGGAWLIAALWPLIGGMRQQLGLRRLPASADAMLVMSLLALPFYGPLVQKLPGVGDPGFAGQQTIYVIGGTNIVPGGEAPIMYATLGALFAVAALVGFAWRWHAWIVCWASFYGIAITCFTGFFTNRGGIWAGLWGTLDFWWRPETQPQTASPYYYGLLLSVYEFLPLLVAAAGATYLFARGTLRDRAIAGAALALIGMTVVMPASAPLIGPHRATAALAVAGAAVLALRLPETTKFLAFWSVASFFAFTAIEQKEPWLAIQIIVPLSLLAARLVNDAIAAVPAPSLPRPEFRMYARPRLVQGSLAAAVAGIAVFSLHSGLLASWGHGNVRQLDRALALQDDGDTPVELIQPAQTAPDVREIRDAIERAGVQSGEGHNLTVVVDTSHEFAVPWLWYLRDYANLKLEDLRRPYDVPAGAVVLADIRNRQTLRGTGGTLALTYTQRWALPRSRYDGLAATDIAEMATSREALATWSRYLRDRTTIGDLRTLEGVAYFPQALSAAMPATRQSDVLSTSVEPAP